MAQTKSRSQKQGSSGSRSTSSKGSKSRSKAGSTNARSKASTNARSRSRSNSSSKSRPSSTRSRSTGGSRSRSTRSRSPSSSRSGGAKRSTSRSSGASRGRTQQASSASSNGILEKAKVPATAAGIALIGIAGGLAASGRGGKRRASLLPGGRGPKLPRIDVKKALKGIHMPKPNGSTIDWVEEKAKGVGDASYRVSELASEARGVQKAVSGEDS